MIPNINAIVAAIAVHLPFCIKAIFIALQSLEHAMAARTPRNNKAAPEKIVTIKVPAILNTGEKNEIAVRPIPKITPMSINTKQFLHEHFALYIIHASLDNNDDYSSFILYSKLFNLLPNNSI